MVEHAGAGTKIFDDIVAAIRRDHKGVGAETPDEHVFATATFEVPVSGFSDRKSLRRRERGLA